VVCCPNGEQIVKSQLSILVSRTWHTAHVDVSHTTVRNLIISRIAVSQDGADLSRIQAKGKAEDTGETWVDDWTGPSTGKGVYKQNAP
jgi:hypothetical protein